GNDVGVTLAPAAPGLGLAGTGVDAIVGLSTGSGVGGSPAGARSTGWPGPSTRYAAPAATTATAPTATPPRRRRRSGLDTASALVTPPSASIAAADASSMIRNSATLVKPKRPKPARSARLRAIAPTATCEPKTPRPANGRTTRPVTSQSNTA